jgi:uncharacterized membrane protein YdjX (TVP38/TMEM64 family)
MPARSTVVKVVIGVAVVAALIAAIRFLPIKEWLTDFQTYVRGLGALGYVVYALVYAVCVVFFVPASILTVGAGVIFGLIPGTIVVVCGATLGATLAFLLARTVLRKRIEKMTEGNPKFAALDRAITREGAKIAFLVRLAVVFPFTYINYALGLTGVTLRTFFLTTLIGITPATFAFVYIGAAAKEAATTANNTKLAVFIIGGIAALAVSVFVGRIATKAINGEVAK